jgi:hypothetical protein
MHGNLSTLFSKRKDSEDKQCLPVLSASPRRGNTPDSSDSNADDDSDSGSSSGAILALPVHQEVIHPDPYFWVYNPQTLEKVRCFIIQDESCTIRRGRTLHFLKEYIETQNGFVVAGPPRHAYTEKSVANEYTKSIDLNYCKENVDFVTPIGSVFYEIYEGFISQNYIVTEEHDFKFASIMQGLLNVRQNQVWECLNDQYDPHDRNPLLRMYIKSRIKKLFQTFPPNGDIRRLCDDAIHKYRVFTQRWVIHNYKYITPLITSAAIVFIRHCINAIPSKYHVFSHEILARVLWRNELSRADFAEALFWHMGSIDQSRNGRNPSYKQMNIISNTHVQSYYKLLRTLKNLEWDKIFPLHDDIVITVLDIPCFDWYDMAGQIPIIHAKYKTFEDNIANMQQLYHNSVINKRSASAAFELGNDKRRNPMSRNTTRVVDSTHNSVNDN